MFFAFSLKDVKIFFDPVEHLSFAYFATRAEPRSGSKAGGEGVIMFYDFWRKVENALLHENIRKKMNVKCQRFPIRLPAESKSPNPHLTPCAIPWRSQNKLNFFAHCS